VNDLPVVFPKYGHNYTAIKTFLKLLGRSKMLCWWLVVLPVTS